MKLWEGIALLIGGLALIAILHNSCNKVADEYKHSQERVFELLHEVDSLKADLVIHKVELSKLQYSLDSLDHIKPTIITRYRAKKDSIHTAPISESSRINRAIIAN